MNQKIKLQRKKNAAAQRRWRARNPEKARSNDRSSHLRLKQRRRENPDLAARWSMKHTYKLTEQELDFIMEHRKGRCQSCGEFETVKKQGHCSLSVDHDHKTGKFRGLLCHRCNLAEGYLKTVDKARKLAAYMKRTA